MRTIKYKYHSGLQCLECGDKIFSTSRHDFHRCKCGKCFVDGGLDYFRYGFQDEKRIKIIKIRIYPIKNSRNWHFKPNQVAPKLTKEQKKQKMIDEMIAMVEEDKLVEAYLKHRKDLTK